jgi:hypothetical protein
VDAHVHRHEDTKGNSVDRVQSAGAGARECAGRRTVVQLDTIPGAANLIEERRLLSISYDGVEVVLPWSLDEKRPPVPGLAAVPAVLQPQRDSWGIAFWFTSINARLGNRAPSLLIESDTEAVLDAAKAEVRAQLHD